MQAKSKSRIKLSQDGHFYPGTVDRVCLIQGSFPNACLAVEMVLSKLYDLQSIQLLSSTLATTNLNERLPVDGASTSFIVRLLVPQSYCGRIIGRSGSNIKSLKDKTNVTQVQLSPKEHEMVFGGTTPTTSERILTITGPNLSSCVNCIQIVMESMARNPEISRYINMTTIYSKLLAAAPSSYAVAPSTGFFLEHEPLSSISIQSLPYYGQAMFPSSPSRVADFGPYSSSFPQYQTPPMDLSAQYCPPFYASNSPDRNGHLSGYEYQSSPHRLEQNFQAQVYFPSQILEGSIPVTVKLGVPTKKIGLILGRGGKTLNDLQALSHTKIRISQQGDFIPGHEIESFPSREMIHRAWNTPNTW